MGLFKSSGWIVDGLDGNTLGALRTVVGPHRRMAGGGRGTHVGKEQQFTEDNFEPVE